ncbi:MAG: hypothetical protein V3V14_10255 [Saprospiraceae bacterium]
MYVELKKADEKSIFFKELLPVFYDVPTGWMYNEIDKTEKLIFKTEGLKKLVEILS